MHAHIVLAHPEPQSFNGQLVAVAEESLEKSGWKVTVSDLYAIGFDPCERPQHYPDRRDPKRFNVQAEQRYASDRGTFAKEIKDEIKRLDAADLLILQYPMWWHLPPAMLKGWYDRVLLYGEVYTSTKRFEAGRFAGKRAMLSVTVGTSADTYAYNGRSGDIELMLWPVNFTLAFVGYTVLHPFVAYGVEAGIGYSDPSAVEMGLVGIKQELRARLNRVDEIGVVPFNRMEQWGSDGRIKPDAPVYSPFIRHKSNMKFV